MLCSAQENTPSGLPDEQYRRFYLQGLLHIDNVLVVNTHPYQVNSERGYILTRLDSHLYRIAAQTILSEEEFQSLLPLLERYPLLYVFPGPSTDPHKALARASHKLATIGLRVYRSADNAYGLKTARDQQ